MLAQKKHARSTFHVSRTVNATGVKRRFAGMALRLKRFSASVPLVLSAGMEQSPTLKPVHVRRAIKKKFAGTELFRCNQTSVNAHLVLIHPAKMDLHEKKTALVRARSKPKSLSVRLIPALAATIVTPLIARVQ